MAKSQTRFFKRASEDAERVGKQVIVVLVVLICTPLIQTLLFITSKVILKP